VGSVTGRNNWTFDRRRLLCGSDAGGERVAILYSLVATCKAHGIDPWAYLRDVLERISYPSQSAPAELLPRHSQTAQTTTVVKPPHPRHPGRPLLLRRRRPPYLRGMGFTGRLRSRSRVRSKFGHILTASLTLNHCGVGAGSYSSVPLSFLYGV